VSEPEELILEGAHFATRHARALWLRHVRAPASSGVPLARIRTRLELFVSALFSRPIPICAIEPNAPATWLSRLASGRPRARHDSALCATDGQRVYLPGVLDVQGNDENTLAMYRLLAVEQSARIVRQSHAFARLRSQQTRDLFQLADAAIVDRWIVLNAPGLAEVLAGARSAALAQRDTPRRRQQTDPVERAVCELLGSDPERHTLPVPDGASAEQCAQWAEAMSGSYARPGRYQPIAPVLYWGELLEPCHASETPWHGAPDDRTPPSGRRLRTAEMRRRPRPRQDADDEDDPGTGSWVIRADDPQENVEDPFGLQRPADREHDADPEGLGDSLSELPEARVVRTPERPLEVLRSGERPEPSERTGSNPLPPHGAVSYPEWDYRTNQYRQPGAIVRQPVPELGDAGWAVSNLSRHAGLVRCVRTRFERLRPRRVRLFRQIDGTDVDICAYVTAAADRQAGVATDGRFYVASRAARRELAVALLLDVSASTDAWVSANRRIVDVEKEAMLVVCEALDALGDRYALFGFSGEGPTHVNVLPLKGFEEPSSLQIRRRIAALDSDGYTRLGASIRHVTAALCRETAASRLVLLLSDGKPNDVDIYEGRYGIEDTRQAVTEARSQGVTVFCLTVDREAPRYAGRVFGRRGFAVLHKAEQLPAVVVEVLRHLIRV
jgi:nitric oxide reductase NorD protein